MEYERIGLSVPEILLPRQGADLTRWAVVACDQYTSVSYTHLTLPTIYSV